MSITLDQAVNYRSKYEITVDSKAFKNQKTNGYSFKKNFFRNAINVFLVLSMVVVGLLGSGGASQKANAAPWDFDVCDMIAGNGSYLNSRELKIMGPALLPGSKGTNGNKDSKITAYEKFGTSGTNWTVWRGPKHDAKKDTNAFTKAGDKFKDDNAYFANGVCVPAGEIVSASFANGVFGLSKIIVFSSNLAYQMAYEGSSSIIDPLQEQISLMITGANGQPGLKDSLYLDFMIPMIMFAALYMAWVGIVKRRSTDALHAALWMVGSAVTGMILLSNPMIIPAASNGLVSNVTTGIMTGVSGGAASGLADIGNGELCALGETGNDKASRNTSRLVQCSVWYSFIYVPWATGQFGFSPETADPAGSAMYVQFKEGMKNPIVLTENGTGDTYKIKNPNWAIYQIDNQINHFKSDTDTEDNWAAIPVAMLGQPSESGEGMVNTTWSGDGNASLISKAFFSLIAASGAAIMIIVLSMSMIIFELGLVILMMVAPLFLLIGVHPGFGRKIALKWVETIISLTLKRIVLSVLLGVMITFYSIAISLSENDGVSWFQVVVIVIAISIAGLKYKGLLTDMFGQVDLGGGGAMKPEPGKTGGLVKGAIAGGVGALIGSNLAGKAGGSTSTIIKRTTSKTTSSNTRVEPKKSSTKAGSVGGGPKKGSKQSRVEPNIETPNLETPVTPNLDKHVEPGSTTDFAPFEDSKQFAGTTWNDDEKEKTKPTPRPESQTSTGGTKRVEPELGKLPRQPTKLTPRGEKVVKKIETKRTKLEDKLQGDFARTTTKRRVMGNMSTLGGGIVKGAFMGYNGGDVSFIASSAQNTARQSKVNKHKQANNNITQAKARQKEYSKAWEKMEGATTTAEKQAATEAINKTYGSMSKREKTYIKQVGKVQRKFGNTDAVGPNNKPPRFTNKQREDGLAPVKKAINPNVGLPPRRPRS